MSGLLLVTGGTGKTGRRLVEQLQAQGIGYRVASRGVEDSQTARRFDWNDEATWADALMGVSGVYLVAPPGGDPATMIRFVEAAIQGGAARFVLLSASLLPAGGPGMGQVHLWLQENAREWAVLRPSWFMQNFSEGPHRATIVTEGAIYSATEKGRVPFISADDIAAAALGALTTVAAPNTDFILTGGETLSYDDVAALIGKAVGRDVKHTGLSVEALAVRLAESGMAPFAAQVLAAMDGMIASGAEDRTTDCVQVLSGRPPTRFGDFISASKGAWGPSQ